MRFTTLLNLAGSYVELRRLTLKWLELGRAVELQSQFEVTSELPKLTVKSTTYRPGSHLAELLRSMLMAFCEEAL